MERRIEQRERREVERARHEPSLFESEDAAAAIAAGLGKGGGGGFMMVSPESRINVHFTLVSFPKGVLVVPHRCTHALQLLKTV